jgi:hypothetical protein
MNGTRLRDEVDEFGGWKLGLGVALKRSYELGLGFLEESFERGGGE